MVNETNLSTLAGIKLAQAATMPSVKGFYSLNFNAVSAGRDCYIIGTDGGYVLLTNDVISQSGFTDILQVVYLEGFVAERDKYGLVLFARKAEAVAIQYVRRCNNGR